MTPAIELTDTEFAALERGGEVVCQLPTTEVVGIHPHRNGKTPRSGVSARASMSVVGGLHSSRSPRRGSAHHFDWSWTPALTASLPRDGTSMELRSPSSSRPSDPISRGRVDRRPTRTDSVSRASARRLENRLRLFCRPVQLVHTGPRVRPRRGRTLAPRSGFLVCACSVRDECLCGASFPMERRSVGHVGVGSQSTRTLRNRRRAGQRTRFLPRLKPWASSLFSCEIPPCPFCGEGTPESEPEENQRVTVRRTTRPDSGAVAAHGVEDGGQR